MTSFVFTTVRLIIKIMNNQTYPFRKKIVFASIFFLITISAVSSINESQNPANASTTTSNIKADNNSTFSKSGSNKENNDVGMTFVIPNANSNSSNTTHPPTDNIPASTINNETNKPSINSNQTDNLQRGEYKVDENGIHYYNINNCSEVKGSSGIGDLSECEDAEKQMRDDM